jgi:lipoprotein signal peptidase
MGAWGELIVAASGTFLLDRATKALALRLTAAPGAAGGARRFLEVVRNERPVFVRAGAGRVCAAVWVGAISCTLGALAANPGLGSHTLRVVGSALALAGAAGNLSDRIRSGAVTDFIALGRWPVFNFADVAIIVGIALVLGSVF